MITRKLGLGVVPLGYDHYGPKVTDPDRRRINQEIVLNETGVKIKQAWNWKLEGMRDFEIQKKLETIGVVITKQTLSAMWRKPFYCGIQTNSFVDGRACKGNWEPMVSEEVFWAVQRILDGNKHGYKVERDIIERPLIGTLLCPQCKGKLTGYVAKKKHHYYKCQKCKGVSINAVTSHRFPNRTGAHEQFIELLDSFKVEEKYLPPFKLQLKKTFEKMNAQTYTDRKELEQVLKNHEKELEKLEERFAFGLMNDEALYNKFKARKQQEIDQVRAKLEDTNIEISNLDYIIEKSMEISQNVSRYWWNGDLETKRRIQKMVFPEGIVIDTKKRQYLTSKVNALFSANKEFKKVTEGINEGLPINPDEESSLVAGVRLEPFDNK